MSKSNAEIIREFVEQVTNARHINLMYQYASKDCLIHTPPYIGLGTWVFPTNDGHLIIQKIAKNAPATGQLQVGDELVQVSDLRHTWDSFEQLIHNPWETGQAGETLTLTVRRAGKLMDIPLVRSRVEGDDITVEEFLQYIGDNYLKEWSEYKTEIKLIVAQDDLVAIYAITHGTHIEFHADAVWSGFYLARMKDGKIIEWWGLEDGASWGAQLGYQATSPVVEKA